MAMKLQDSALLAVARDLWLQSEGNGLIMSINWRERTSRVQSLVTTILTNVPSPIQKQIKTCVKRIGDEISELINCRYFNCLFINCLKNLRPQEIVWTSNFTIDRVKTLIATTSVRTQVEGYPCPTWAKQFWNSQSEDARRRAARYFGDHRFWVFFNWVCYMKTTLFKHMIDDAWASILRNHTRHRYLNVERGRRHTFHDHLNHFKRYYKNNTPSENVFRFLVISGIVENIPFFLVKLCPTEQRRNVYLMTKLLITEHNKKHFRPSSHVLVSTLLCLWSNLETTDQRAIIQDHFDHFFHFILDFPGTDMLVAALNFYNPSDENLRSNRRYLEDTIAAIPKERNLKDCFKQRLIFHVLYKKFGDSLAEIDIINLIEKLLIIKDTETAIMIAQVLDNEKKDLLLDAIHKIWSDLWKDSVEKDIFLNFFFEVQSGLISSTLMKI